jgi:hypothetical protein
MNTVRPTVTVASPRSALDRPARVLSGRFGALVAVTGLLLISLYLRTRTLDAAFWIDEGLSVGIASHPLIEIPSVLRQDGSPPLYYLLLHAWMEVFGRTEEATHALSVVFGLLTVPAGLWAGWSLFGRRAGLACALLCALNPFITAYAQETRMYALMILLGLVASGAYAHVFVYRRRGHIPLLVAALTLMLYGHNWTLFFIAGALVALIPCVRRSAAPRALIADAVLAFGAAGLLYVPWLPTLVFQTLHTGAPWGNPPSVTALFLRAPAALAAGAPAAVALVLGGGTGLAAMLTHRRGAERTAVLALLILPVVAIFLAWAVSQVSPAWAHRYLAVLLGPLLLLFGVVLARAGRLGLAALALIAIFWVIQQPFDDKSNARSVAAQAGERLRPGDLVISTHPEQVPVLLYYLPPGLMYATTLGPVEDPRIMDWRDALSRLELSTPATDLQPELDRLAVGTRVLLVRPLIGEGIAWDAPWTRLVRRRSAEWGSAMGGDRRFRRLAAFPREYPELLPRGVRAVLYTKTRE